MTWITDIVLGLRALGGEASLPDLYHWIELNRHQEFPPNWKSAIRASLQAHCAESPQYREGNPDLFRNTGRGWWAIRKIDDTNTVNLPPRDEIGLVFTRLTEDELEGLRNLTEVERRTLILQKVDELKRNLFGK